MKKLLISLCTLLMLVGCSTKVEEPGEVVTIANPMKSVDLKDVAIMGLNAPEGATDISCFIIDDGENEPLYELDFKYDGKEYAYRAQATNDVEAYDSTGLYNNWYLENTVDLGNVSGHLMLANEGAGLYWIDVVLGINYSLSCNTSNTEEKMVEVAKLVSGNIQGNVDAPYMGKLLDPDDNTVEISIDDEDVIHVEVNLVDVAVFKGTGTEVDGSVEFTAVDEDGHEMAGSFYPASDGSFILKVFTDWDKIEFGKEYVDFWK